uniref:myc box-dependent-interacting protein 1 isoform X2 n=1 Tax=Ciona intestinalis TaxID=7719 RepID=UPI000EF4C3B4|nr:myc box-dependent-interacting protein 1 isoform X2 [Ciona intestinalis]|eukprot:XP_026690950.1 myc box-dependent-interacting protein 1 isoform X2 [Ciona intestinalis]
MAESSKKDGSARLKRNVSKMAFRSREKMLRTFGVGEETKDEIIDNYVHLVNKQQNQVNKFQRDIKTYLNSITAMKTAAKMFYDSLGDLYEDEWMGKDMLASLAKTTDLLYNDLHARLSSEVITALHDHLNQCNEMKIKVGKRGRKLVDYDASRRNLHTMQNSKKLEESKITKAREHVLQTQSTYDTFNTQLHDELPNLYDSRVLLCTDTLINIATAEKSFYLELAEVRTKLMHVLVNLKDAFNNGEYKIQRMNPNVQNDVARATKEPSSDPATLPADEVDHKRSRKHSDHERSRKYSDHERSRDEPRSSSRRSSGSRTKERESSSRQRDHERSKSQDINHEHSYEKSHEGKQRKPRSNSDKTSHQYVNLEIGKSPDGKTKISDPVNNGDGPSVYTDVAIDEVQTRPAEPQVSSQVKLSPNKSFSPSAEKLEITTNTEHNGMPDDNQSKSNTFPRQVNDDVDASENGMKRRSIYSGFQRVAMAFSRSNKNKHDGDAVGQKSKGFSLSRKHKSKPSVSDEVKDADELGTHQVASSDEQSTSYVEKSGSSSTSDGGKVVFAMVGEDVVDSCDDHGADDQMKHDHDATVNHDHVDQPSDCENNVSDNDETHELDHVDDNASSIHPHDEHDNDACKDDYEDQHHDDGNQNNSGYSNKGNVSQSYKETEATFHDHSHDVVAHNHKNDITSHVHVDDANEHEIASHDHKDDITFHDRKIDATSHDHKDNPASDDVVAQIVNKLTINHPNENAAQGDSWKTDHDESHDNDSVTISEPNSVSSGSIVYLTDEEISDDDSIDKSGKVKLLPEIQDEVPSVVKGQIEAKMDEPQYSDVPVNKDDVESPIYDEPTTQDHQLEDMKEEPAASEVLPPHFLYKAQAAYPYNGSDSDELTFVKGDLIYVVEFPDPDEQDEGWQMGILQSSWDEVGTTATMGVFPENFTKKI